MHATIIHRTKNKTNTLEGRTYFQNHATGTHRNKKGTPLVANSLTLPAQNGIWYEQPAAQTPGLVPWPLDPTATNGMPTLLSHVLPDPTH